MLFLLGGRKALMGIVGMHKRGEDEKIHRKKRGRTEEGWVISTRGNRKDSLQGERKGTGWHMRDSKGVAVLPASAPDQTVQ